MRLNGDLGRQTHSSFINSNDNDHGVAAMYSYARIFLRRCGRNLSPLTEHTAKTLNMPLNHSRIYLFNGAGKETKFFDVLN